MGKSFKKVDKHKFRSTEYIPIEQYVACGHKVTYETERIALKKSNEMSEFNGLKYRVYKCEFCKKFHTSTS